MAVGDNSELSVLLVDDQPIVAHGVRQRLATEADIVLHYCQDPREAFSMVSRVSAHLILQDLSMPEIDGITLVRMFRNHPATRDLPIIILSGKESPKNKAEAFKAAANDYIVKLPDALELIARIRAQIAAYLRMKSLARRASELGVENDQLASTVEELHRKVASASRREGGAGSLDPEIAIAVLQEINRLQQFQAQLDGTQLTEQQRFCVRQFREASMAIRNALAPNDPQSATSAKRAQFPRKSFVDGAKSGAIQSGRGKPGVAPRISELGPVLERTPDSQGLDVEEAG